MCNIIDLSSSFDNENNPKDLNDEEKNYDINIKIQKQRIKLYVTRELVMKRNLDMIRGLVWGEFTHTLQSMIKY